MDSIKKIRAVTALYILSILAVSCDINHHGMTSSGSSVVTVTNVSPADGTAGVSPRAVVSLTFSGPVDTASVARNLHLTGGASMLVWRDSVNVYGGFGRMNLAHEGHMMNWVDSIHEPGHFQWNDRLDSCDFVPDAPLAPRTEYLYLMYESGMMGNGGGKMGGSNHNNNGYHLYRFTTGS